MATRRTKNPKAFPVTLTVQIRGTAPYRIDDLELDEDGQYVEWEVARQLEKFPALLAVTFERGTNSDVISATLRKVADIVDQHGKLLGAMPSGKCGYFDSGQFVVDHAVYYDDFGAIKTPIE